MVQLWFVTTTGLVFLVLFLTCSPYRDEVAGRIQIVALVQLEFTYVTAAGEVIVRQGTLKSVDCSQVSIGVDGRPDGWRACPECRALPKTESVLNRLNSVINGGAEANGHAKDSTLPAGEMAEAPEGTGRR